MARPSVQFVKYGKISAVASPRKLTDFLKSRTCEVTEKIDGGNCQIRNIRWQLVPGSKANVLTGRKINSLPWFEKFVRWVYSNNSLYNLPGDVVVFGEWAGNHTIDYGKENDQFFMLDVLNTKQKRFMTYGQAKSFLDDNGIKGMRQLRTLAKGNVSVETLEKLLEEPSDFYSGPKEGLVIKDYSINPPIRVKTYHPDFSEKIETSEGKIELLTPARFRKTIYRLIEGCGNSKIRYVALVAKVVEDVREEEGVTPSIPFTLHKLRQYLEDGSLKGTESHLTL